jgi:hypothetical protein
MIEAEDFPPASETIFRSAYRRAAAEACGEAGLIRSEQCARPSKRARCSVLTNIRQADGAEYPHVEIASTLMRGGRRCNVLRIISR